MVDQVVAREGIDALALAAQMRDGDRHQLTIAGRRRGPLGKGQGRGDRSLGLVHGPDRAERR